MSEITTKPAVRRFVNFLITLRSIRMAKNLLLLNGPNLNLLGTREPDVYGACTLNDVETTATEQAKSSGAQLFCFQSNHEGALIDRIHAAKQQNIDFIIFNPGAYTHTSIALRDALVGVAIPFIELHISNVHQREAFRHQSFFSDIALGVICGLGTDGYRLAIDFALRKN